MVQAVPLLALLFLSFSGAALARAPQNPLNQHEPGMKVQLSLIPFISIQEICQDRVILDFDLWYEAWIVQYLQKNNDSPGTHLNKALQGGVKEHIEEVKVYLAKLEAIQPKLAVFPPLHLDLKVRKLNHDVSGIIDLEARNPFANPEIQKQLQADLGHYLPEFIQGIVKAPLDDDMITNVGRAFKADWDIRDQPEGQLMSAKVNELATPLRATLRAIIKVFSSPKSTTYKGLSPDQKKHLQHFFDTFRYLLTPEEIQDEVLTGLVGTKRPTSGVSNVFFTDAVFKYLKKTPTSYEDYINRDWFITLPTPETELEKIHKAAKNLFYSWDFLAEFDADPTDMQLGQPEEVRNHQGDNVIQKRKQAKLRLMMYKVYLFARVDGVIPADEPQDNQSILRTLFDWVKTTDAFDQPEEVEPSDQGIDPEQLKHMPLQTDVTPVPRRKHTQLFKPAKFKRFYVPLLYYICGKIDHCKLLSPENKPQILKHYQAYGNFEELKKKHTISKLLPIEVIDEISAAVEDNEIRLLEDKLDDLMRDLPDTKFEEEPTGDDLPSDKVVLVGKKKPDVGVTVKPGEEDQEIIKSHAPVIHRVEKKRTPAKLMAAVRGPQEDAFTPIVEKFLPPTAEITDQTKVFVGKLLEKAEAAGNPVKKAIMRTLLIRHILKIYKTQDDLIREGKGDPSSNPAKKLAYLVNDKLVAQIRGSFSWTATAGLKNFLFRAMNPNMGLDYRSLSPVEAELFRNDIIFFIFFADEDRISRIRAEKPLRPKQELAKIAAAMGETRLAIYKYLIPEKAKSTNADKELRPALIAPLMSSPLLMERLSAYEFFVPFLDFFGYYENTETTPAGTYYDYGFIYMNFYNFLNSLRAEMFLSVSDPHRYVLDKLEGCMAFTETIEHFRADHADTVCKLSHRKYAELYYFYKVYLIAKNKPLNVDLRPFGGRGFDTHVRIFINFAQEEPGYRHALTTACAKEKTAPICVVWELFGKLMVYLHDFSLTSSYVDDVFKSLDWSNPNMRFHVLGALEATFFNTENSNVKDYSKLLGLVERLSDGGLDLLGFSEGDVPLLTSYLKRTYRKLIFTSPEANVAEAVQRILTSESNADISKDLFGTYLVFGDVIYLDYLKLFLLLASSDQEFRRIAEVIVRAKGGRALIRMNGYTKHAEFANFIAAVGGRQLPLSDRFEAIRNFIKAKYEETHSTCVNLIKEKILGGTVGFSEEWDPLADITEENEQESLVAIKKEQETFDTLVETVKQDKSPVRQPEKIVVEQLIQIERRISRKSSQLLDDLEVNDDEDVLEVHYQDDFNDRDEEPNINLKDPSKATFVVNSMKVEANKGLSLTSSLAAFMNKAYKNAEVINAKAQSPKITSSDVSTEKANKILGQFMNQASGKKIADQINLKKKLQDAKKLI